MFAVVTDKDERYQWIQQTLIKLRYGRLSKADKGIVIRYLMKVSGYSRKQVTRLIGQYIQFGQVRQVNAGNDQLIQQLSDPEDDESAKDWQRDVAILSSIPRVGRVVLATLLAEASEPLSNATSRPCKACVVLLRSPRRSGKSNLIVKRMACSHRLRNAIYHWTRIAVQHDEISKAKYKHTAGTVMPEHCAQLATAC